MEVHPESREKTSLIFIEPAILRKMAKFKKKYKKMIEEIQASLPWFQIFRMKQQKKTDDPRRSSERFLDVWEDSDASPNVF